MKAAQESNPNIRLPSFKNSLAWRERKLGDIFQERISKGHAEKPVLSATQERGVIPYALLEKSVIRDNQNLIGYKLVKRGDFVISLRSFEGGLEYSNYEGIISPAYVVLESVEKIDVGFFRFLFKSDSFVSSLQNTLNNNLRDGKSISYNQAKNIVLRVPELDEQKEVAACLAGAQDLVDAQTKKLSLFISHRRGLMQQLFPVQERGL